MNDELKQQFELDLVSANPQSALNETCRRFLKEKIMQAHIGDKYMEECLRTLADNYVVLLNYQDVEENNQTIRRSNSFQRQLCFIIPSIGVGISLFTVACECMAWRFFGWLITIGCGFYLGWKLSRPITSIQPTIRRQLLSTADDILIAFNQYLRVINKLLIFNSLESYDRELLEWLQQQYCESTNEQYKRELGLVLRHSGYELLEYEENIAEYFDCSQANVEHPTTTYYAIKSKHSGYFVLRGHVVFPL